MFRALLRSSCGLRCAHSSPVNSPRDEARRGGREPDLLRVAARRDGRPRALLVTGGWESTNPALVLVLAGVALLAASLAVLVHTVIRFAVEGLGTPSPVAPTQNVVVIAVILGQAAVLGRPALLVYAGICRAANGWHAGGEL